MKALLGRKPGIVPKKTQARPAAHFSRDLRRLLAPKAPRRQVLAAEPTIAAAGGGVEPQAELLGWAMNYDGYHMAMPSREEIGKCLAAALALRAGLSPGAIDYYNAHDQARW